MPAVQPVSKSSTVLVTGGSGFIGAHVVLRLLEVGFSVRTTVRSTEKGEYLTKLFASKGYTKDFSYVIVKDISVDGAHDEAVKGVVGIAHVASPFHFDLHDVQKDYIDPAVKGTVGLLRSAHLYGKDVKRIVITSSHAAVRGPSEGQKICIHTEEDWNELSPREIQEKGNSVSPVHAYCGSKVLAERAGWEFVKDNNPSYDLAVANPPWVLGPIIHEVPTREKLNTSVAIFDAFTRGEKPEKDLEPYAGSWVDVRDLAEVHVQILIQETGGGERWAASAGPFTWQDVIDPLFDLPNPPENASRGVKGSGNEFRKLGATYLGTKSEARLGIKYRPISETAVEMYNSLLEYSDKVWK